MPNVYRFLFMMAFVLLYVVPSDANAGSGERKAARVVSETVHPEIVYGPPLVGPLGQLDESFEGTTFPPAGWIKLNPDGGPGWNRQLNGTSPVPGWLGGTITVPPDGGNAVAFCTWNTGGTTSNDQWLVTPQIMNVQASDSLTFWLRYWPNAYADTVEIRISTTTPIVGNFTVLVARLGFPAAPTTDTNWNRYGYRLTNFVTAGSNIYIAFRERVVDNVTYGASISLDRVQVGVTAPPPPPQTIGWQQSTTGATVGFDGLYMLSDRTGWLSGDQGRILKTTDGGRTWTGQTSGVTTYLYSICFVDENIGYSAGTVVLKTTNGGATWTNLGSISGLSFLHAIDCISADTVWIGGTEGLARTTNGGTSWTTVLPRPGETVYQVDFANSQVGWAVWGVGLTSGGILKTTNGGATWVAQHTTMAALHDVHAVNDNVAWAVGYQSTVRRTTNGGATWESITTPIPAGLWAWGVHFADPSVGWISGDQGYVVKTTNGGATWYRQPVPSAVLARPLYQIKSTSSMHVVTGGDGGVAMWTENGGEAPVKVVSPTSLAFGSVQIGRDSVRTFTVRNTGTMALRVDSLASTNPRFSVVGITLPRSVAVGETLFVPARFTPADTTLQSGTIRVVSNDPYNPLRTVSVSGRGVPPVSVQDGDGLLPTVFALDQNYPNPFNPATEIRYALPRSSFVTIKVYTLLGQEIATLVNGNMPAGNHVARWDGRNIDGTSAGSGMYFYRMDANSNDGNSFVSVRKMLLLK